MHWRKLVIVLSVFILAFQASGSTWAMYVGSHHQQAPMVQVADDDKASSPGPHAHMQSRHGHEEHSLDSSVHSCDGSTCSCSAICHAGMAQPVTPSLSLAEPSPDAFVLTIQVFVEFVPEVPTEPPRA